MPEWIPHSLMFGAFMCAGYWLGRSHKFEILHAKWLAAEHWRVEVQEKLIVNWGLSEVNEKDARTAVNDLIRLECQMALDPLVSEQAADLIEKETSLLKKDLSDANNRIVFLRNRVDSLKGDLGAYGMERTWKGEQ